MINFNGELVEKPEISPYNRALLYGDGLFETIRYSAGKLNFWEDHYFRLMASMRILRMEIPMEFTPEYLQQQLLETIAANNLEKSAARVRLTVFRSPGGTYLPTDNKVGYFAFAKALKTPFFTLGADDYEVDIYKDHYLNADLLTTLKTTSKLINITGSIYAKENNLENCLLVNNNKMVVEALNGNLFLVKGKHIKTPPLDSGCLRGIIRKQLLDMLKTLDGFTVEEAVISPFELQKADELFITNAIVGIQPISKYRKKAYGNEVAKELLGKLNAMIRLGS
ncbi:MAG: aminotransferase class IV [Leeuwenhoekiella sp.]